MEATRMKLDRDYSHIKVCPNTKEILTTDEYKYSYGVCPKCGHNDNSTFTHKEVVTGKWLRPTLWEWVRGKRAEFIQEVN